MTTFASKIPTARQDNITGKCYTDKGYTGKGYTDKGYRPK